MPSITSQSIDAFLGALASKTPAPGGGATACLAGALACAQAQMVVEYSLGKKRLADHEPMLSSARDRLANARKILLRLADEDALAYQILNELQRLEPKDPRRSQELPAATALCADIPLSALATCADAARVIQQLPDKTNEHLASDLSISAVLLHAAGESCAHNVKVNLPQLDEPGATERQSQCDSLLGAIVAALRAAKQST